MTPIANDDMASGQPSTCISHKDKGFSLFLVVILADQQSAAGPY
jgi:hypothetical protein